MLEETGLRVISCRPIAIYSDPKYSVTYLNGDQVQIFAIVFIVDEWDGELVRETDETSDIGFFPLDNLPDTHEMYVETLEDLKRFDGQFIVK